MSMALKFKPDLAFALSSRNSGSSGCWAAISDQSTPISPMAAMTQLRSAVRDAVVDEGVGCSLEAVAAAEDPRVVGVLEGISEDAAV